MIFSRRHLYLFIDVCINSRPMVLALVAAIGFLLFGHLSCEPNQIQAAETQAANESTSEQSQVEEVSTKPADTPAEQPEQQPAEETAPAETNSEETAPAEEKPAEQPATAPAEESKPTESATATPETPPAEKPAEPAKETPTEAPIDPETGRAAVRPDEGGHIQFNYVGQPWGEVLQDFADASGNSLDWQELPADNLNLTTQHKYTVKEARDLLNRHLLARGFTMLSEDDVLTVVKVEKLDPSLIPRATSENLNDFAPHDFMRVTFSLPHSMEPATAAEDVRILLSPNAKVTPLLASRKLLIIDAVTNLRDVRNLLDAERSSEESNVKPREFLLKNRRADYVADQVMIILGLDPKAIKAPDELKLESKRIDMQMKMLDKNQDISKLLKKGGPEVYIAVNRRRNSILVNAPDSFMLLIEQTIKQLDVSDEVSPDTQSSLTLHQYELVSANPKDVISALENNVSLDPRSKLQGDVKNRTLLATATKADHAKIREIISTLDATILPLVNAEDLQDNEPSTFVRVRFQLPFSMDPATIATKVQPLLSDKATVTPLQASRRLLVTGSAENLLQVRELLEFEELALKSLEDTKDFHIKYLLANEMSQQILSMLEASPAALSNPKGMRFDVQGMKMFMALNEETNSLRIGAHPELIKMIEQIVKQFDIDEAKSVDPNAEPQTLVLYKIVGQNIASLTTMLRELGDISPQTRLQAGPASETLYATATAEQHDKIKTFLNEMRPKKNPRIAANVLEEHAPQEFVQVQFQLPLTLPVSTVSAQIQSFLGPRGTIKTISTSNQLIIDDEVERLIEIRDIIKAEQEALDSRETIREFPIQHLRANEMAQQVLTMLELPPTSVSNSRGVYLYFQGKRFFFAVDEQRNSLRIGAEPALIELVEQIIKQFDLEEDKSIAEGQAIALFKVEGQSVDAVIAMLNDLADLNKQTRLQAGPIPQTLYAIATKVEHDKIRKFLDRIKPKAYRIPDTSPDKIGEFPSGDKIRVRFQLPLETDIAQAAAQIQGIVGAEGRVQSLASSKQLIVTDTAANLLQIRDVLQAEEAALKKQQIIREYPIQHRRSEEMVDSVLTMLGLDPATVSYPSELRTELRALKIFITANLQRNSIVVNASEDKQQTVAEIIKQLDVPQEESATTSASKQSMIPYSVIGRDVNALIKAIMEIEGLDPRTKVTGDVYSYTLYVYAANDDHEKIRQVIEKMTANTIQRVDADKLDEYSPNEVARVTFQLPLSSDVYQTAGQIQGILSPTGKIQYLVSSRQIIVSDTIANLLDVRDAILAEKQTQDALEQIHEFTLEHARADQMAKQILAMLGLPPTAITVPEGARYDLRGMSLYLSVKQQRNALLISAHPELLEIIKPIITRFDVPDAAEDTPSNQTLVLYKVPGQNVTSVIEMLEELGELSPQVRLEVGAATETLYAIAEEADHQRIRKFLDKIAPPQIPSLAPDQLEQHPLHETARVLFQLPLTADVTQSAAQISGIVVPPGRVQALALSKQLLVVETVANLIEIREILRAEEEASESQEQIREFALQHRRADEMLEQVLTMLGLQPESMNPYQMRLELQTLQLFISANEQRNSLLVNAPAERMKLVEDIIKQLDVPDNQNSEGNAQALTMLPYKVEKQDLTSVINTLQEVGGLSPQARLQADPISQTIYAYANEKDHAIIREFLDKTAPESILRLKPEELEQHPMRDLARVRFELPQATDIHQANTQIRGIIGLDGNVQMLASSRQLIVDDTVANLIDIRDILKAEAAALKSANDIREFTILHRRADDMYNQVLTMLGVDPTSMNPNQLRQELTALKVFISTNEQRNSLVVNAPVDKMTKVEQILKQLDVSQEESTNGKAGGLTMVPYKVATRNVESVVKALRDIGNFDPRTRLEGDIYTQTVFAYATKSDHEAIQRFIEKIDPDHVRRVEPEQLEEYPATEVLRVRFQLPQTADMQVIAKQVEGILGRGAKVQSLEASKQLIVVDSATNLIEIREVLKAEKMALEAQNNIREFRLQYRRADEMYKQVLTMLGVEPESLNPNQLRQELQMLKVFISTNDQRNSLVVNAPPEKMRTVEQLIKQLDVSKSEPVDSNQPVTNTDASRLSMVPYKLSTQNAITAIKALEEIGDLEPRTRLQGDPTGNTIYAYASKRDHERIRRFVDEMDPNQVRRVHPDELEDHPAHDIVRVLFQLPLTADVITAEDQIKGILGLKARVQSLESSKQLVVVDTVSNLIDVRDVLYAEEMAAEAYEMPRNFPLQYRRATYVVEQVLILLGLDPSARKTTTELQFEAQRMQMMMQSAQQRGRDVSKLGTQDINIAVNRQQNSLLVNCPPEKMPLIERAIEQIDVPTGEERPADPGPVTMEKYQMLSAGADGVIRALEEIGNLDPKTQMQTDATGKIIFAFATPRDHITIKKMIDKLDGSGRRTEVRWLPPRLPADQVAGSIQALLVGPEKKKERRRPWYYYGYDDDEDSEDLNEGFRVMPDIDNNRLLLWANDTELEEVDNLIEKLSDNSDSVFADRRKVRRIEARDPEATLKLLEQLQSTWSGKNRLEIETPTPRPQLDLESEVKPQPEEEEKKPKEDKQTRVDPRFDPSNWFLAQVLEEPSEQKAQSKVKSVQLDTESDRAPPIKITVNDKGEIIISSEDTEALDRLENLIAQLAPIQTEFHSFELHNIHVLDVVYNLETYFEDELAEEEGQSFRDWYGRMRDTKPKEAPISLGKRPPLRFIDDIGTNTLIVANASENQLRVIKDIIDLYDRPANPELYLHRKTEAIQIQYSQASDIATTLKEVYRDLLSTKDKEFQDKEGKQSLGSISADKPYVFGDAVSIRNGREGPVLVRFSGALSIGVDEISNSVIVSARKEVLEEVKSTISQLDRAAKDDSVVRVHLADGILNAEDLEGIISGALADPWVGGKPNPKSSSSRNRSRSRSRSSRSRNR